MPTINATVFPAQAYVLVETNWSGWLLHDIFNRVETSGWNTPNFGPDWTVFSGLATTITANGLQGLHTHGAVGTTIGSLNPVNSDNVHYSGTFCTTVAPTGGNFEIIFPLRYVDVNNFLDFRVFLAPAGTVSVSVRQVVGGVETNGGFPAVGGVTNVGCFNFEFEANGATIRAKLWQGATEPIAWSTTLSGVTHLSNGSLGAISTITGGVTNIPPIVVQFDNLLAVDLDAVTSDCVTVTRRNTVTGEIVTLRPYIFYDADGALILECGQGLWWDTEPPLNVPLEYCASACDTQVALSANCCFEGAIIAPWVATGGVLTASTAFAHEGSLSGLLTPTGGVTEPQFSQSFAVTQGIPLTFSAWVMSPQGYNGVFLRMSLLYTDGKTEVTYTPVEILDDNEWRFLSATLTPRLDATATFSFVTTGAPPNTTLFYVDQISATQPQAVGTEVCETVTVESDGFWLKNPLHPCLDVEVGICNPMIEDCDEDSRVSYAGMSGGSYAPNTVLLQPVNRRRPIPVNRARRDVEDTLRLIAHDCDARDAILAANEPGDPLLWQAPATYCIADRYMSVGVVSEGYISVDQREDFRLMTLPHVAVDRPQGPADGICGARIMDLCDIYTSWGALNIANFTWTDLLLGEASPAGPGQPVPPAGARTWDMVEAEFADWDAVEAGGTRDWDELRDGL